MRSGAVVRFFEPHVVELEKQLRVRDQHGFFQNIKSVQVEKTGLAMTANGSRDDRLTLEDVSGPYDFMDGATTSYEDAAF